MLNFNDFAASTKRQITEIQKPQETETPKTQETPQAPAPIVQTELKANPSNMVLSKGKFALALASTALIGAALVFAVNRGDYNKLLKKYKNYEEAATSRLNKALNDLNKAQSDLGKAQRSLSEAKAKQLEDAKALNELRERMEKVYSQSSDFSSPSDTAQATEKKADYYRGVIKNLTSIYEDVEAPAGYTVVKKSFKKSLPFQDTTLPLTPKKESQYTSGLIDKLKTKGRIEVKLNAQKSTPQQIKNACLNNEALEIAGRNLASDIDLSYGGRVGWSEEKVARDILQNFYDGNGHSLDGVGILVEKTNNGKYKIKISGNGVFAHEKLIRIGKTSKDNNLEDAGGFGEGAKILVTNLLQKGDSEKITFRSADWQLDFNTDGEVVRRTITHMPEILDGNYIEFETGNGTLATKIIKAMDFFKHSNNPDFKELTYNDENFGFRILKPGEKGNFYLTQRFEFQRDGIWENGVEGLDIIFHKKPDPQEYYFTTGRSFNSGRDRSKMSNDDIYELTKCFAKKMSDDDLLQAILSTQEHWEKFEHYESEGVMHFLSALCETARSRNIGIDFGDRKICVVSSAHSRIDTSFLKTLGYKVINAPKSSLDKAGMTSASDLLLMLSSHKPIKPTEAEAKKLKILEEAIKVIHENFEGAYVSKLKELYKKITPDDYKLNWFSYSDFDESFWSSMPESIAKRNEIFDNDIDIFDTEKFKNLVHEYFQRKINQIDITNYNSKESSDIISLLTKSIDSMSNSLLSQIKTQLKHLNIIAKKDIQAPRFIFDRKAEVGNTFLGEAITDFGTYKGHWVDKTHLNESSFYELLSTWLHEICHKSGGDGTAQFTYKLTDIIEALVSVSNQSPQFRTDMLALEKVFNEIK